MLIRSIIAAILTILGASAQSATLDEILKEHAEAMGGLKNLAAITSAVVSSETEVGGMKGTTMTYFKAPDKIRVDLVLPIMTYTQVCNGDDCWLRDQMGLTHSMSGDLRGLVVTQMALDRGTYMTPSSFNGVVKLLDEPVDIEGKSCYQILVSPVGGTEATLAIDKETSLINRVKLVTDMATVFSYPADYRKVEGIMIAHHTTEATDAGIVAGVNRVQSVKFNTSIPDSLFELRDNTSSNTTGASSVVVPFELYRNHIYFDAEIPGYGKMRFIFDSGAGGTALNKDLVEQLKLDHLGQVEARGVGGADVSEVYQLDSLHIGELSLSDLPVYAMDLSPLQAAGTKRIDGILGYDLLSRFAITVNYEDSSFVIHRDNEVDRSSWGSECRLNLDFRLPYIDARINDGIIGRFRLDTGSGSTVDFNSPFVERNNLIAEERSQYHQVTAFGIGGGSSGLIGELPALELCDYRIDSVLVNYSTSESGIFAGAQTAGNIGAGVLKRFIVTFDYPTESVYFKPIEQFERLNTIRNMAGIVITKSDDSLIVSDVIPGRPGDGLLRVGDRIIAIDGRSANRMSLAEVNSELIGGKYSRVIIDILRGNEKINVEVILDSLY